MRGDEHKQDYEKPMWDLLPLDTIEQVVEVLTFGANKYSADGWRSVPDAKRRYYAALMRHITDYNRGKITDEESGLPHLAHAMCCIVFLMNLE